MNKKLRALIDRAERLIAEREEANDGIRDLRKEVKGQGYDATQIMRLAQLSYDDKKRAKLATANETLALYNRESGLGLVLGLDDITETDRAATSSAPEGPAEREQPPRPDPLPKSSAAVAPAALDTPDDHDWHAKDGAANHAEAVDAIREGIAEHGKKFPTESALRKRLEATIASGETDPQVADIARRTLALYESGDIHGAALVVEAAKRSSSGDMPEIPDWLRRL